MAVYYWVGGTGTWDNSNTANWSATSGGAGGSGYPIAGDTAIFNSSSSGGTVTLGANVTCAILTMTGFTGTLDYGTNKISIVSTSATTVFTGDTTYNVSGTPLIELTVGHTVTFAAGATTEANSVSLTILGGVVANFVTLSGSFRNFFWNSTARLLTSVATKTIYGNLTTAASGGTLDVENQGWTFAASSGTQTITTNGRTYSCFIFIATTGTGQVVLADALDIGTRNFTHTSGTFDCAGFNVSLGAFSSTGTIARTLYMRSGTWTTSGWTASGSDLTLDCGTSTVYVRTGVTFTGGAYTYYNIIAAGSMTFGVGPTVFNDITNLVVPANIVFSGGHTYTFNSFNINGTATEDVQVSSSSATAAILSKASGTVNCQYLGLTYITATGGATWNATNSWQGLAVTGWNVSDPDTLYWVGGSGTWDNSTTTNWSLTPGGTGGAGVPGINTRACFSTASGSGGTVTLGANVTCRLLKTWLPWFGTSGQWSGTLALGSYNIDITGIARVLGELSATTTVTGTGAVRLVTAATTGTRTFNLYGTTAATSANFHVIAGTDTIAGFTNPRNLILTGFSGVFTNVARTVWGDFVASPTMTQTGSTTVMTLRATTPATIDCVGVTINQPITINSTSTYTLVSDLIMGTSRAILLGGGTFDANDFDVTCGSVTLSADVGTVYMGSGDWFVWGAFIVGVGITLYSGTSTIYMKGMGGSKNFLGGGKTYHDLVQAGSGILEVNNSSTFNDIYAIYLPSSIRFVAGTTQTLANFSAAGILNDLLSIFAIPAGSTFTLTKPSGTVNASYLSIKDCIATGGATWNATYSTDAGNNTGWTITNTATTYYWVGGSGTWDNSTTTNWSLSSGGSGGAGYPNINDIVIINASSGGGTITLGADVSCKTLTMTGYTGTLAFGSNKISVGGANGTVYTGATTYSITGTPKLEFVYPGRNGIRTVTQVAVSEANSISLYFTAGIDQIFLAQVSGYRDLDFTGFSGTLNAGGRGIYGSLILSPTMVVGTTTGATSFIGSGSHVIDTKGISYMTPCTFNCTGSYTLLDNLNMGSSRVFNLLSGTFDANGYDVTAVAISSTSANVRSLDMGSGTWRVSFSSGGYALSFETTNLTFDGSAATLKLDGVTNGQPIAPRNLLIHKLIINTTGASTIYDAAFDYIEVESEYCRLSLASNQTLTCNLGFDIKGSAGNQSTLSSVPPGSIAYVSAPTGVVVNPEYLTITDVGARGGAKWDTYGNIGNINGGNSPGWIWYQTNVDDADFIGFF
jgi:hypothetical protein